jgi:hypothetical protein
VANYLVMFSASENHIKFMCEHSGVSRNYYMGEPPEIEPPNPVKQNIFSTSYLDEDTNLPNLS